jgi:hypothetical protein
VTQYPKPPADAPLSICIGQTVHYVHGARCLAGIVIGLPDGPSTLTLYVIDPDVGSYSVDADYSIDNADGSWHWLGVGESAPYPWKALQL